MKTSIGKLGKHQIKKRSLLHGHVLWIETLDYLLHYHPHTRLKYLQYHFTGVCCDTIYRSKFLTVKKYWHTLHVSVLC